MIGLKIGLTVFALILMLLAIIKRKQSNKFFIYFIVLFSIGLVIVSWLTIK